jgi:murein L,D-transpeptidase YafK
VKLAAISAFIALFGMTVSASAHADVKADRVVVAKYERTLTLERDGRAIRAYRIALGAHPAGHKQREGDERTPEGVYAIDARNPNSSYHLSLRISYPNDHDRQRAATNGFDPGGQIMIHGLGPTATSMRVALHPGSDWTNGCVAVTNEEMDEIWQLVEVGTPIEITP